MIIEGNEVFNRVLEADLCIIGAGVAGITIANEFLNTDKKIILVESGGKSQNEISEKLSRGINVGNPYFPIETTRCRAFGGTSQLWRVDLPDGTEGVRLRSLDPEDFEKRDWIPNSGWPFSKEEIDPYYKRAHEVFKIGPYSYYPNDWVKNPKLEYLSFNRSKVQPTLFQFAKKSVFYKDYYEPLEKSENVSVLLHSTVLKILSGNNQKRADLLSVISKNKNKFSVKAAKYVIAAGGLETARLLLLSNNEAEEGLGNKHDLVGRYFMEHPHQWKSVGTFYPSNSESFNKLEFYKPHFIREVPVMGYLALSNNVKKAEKLQNCTIGLSGKSKRLLSASGLGEAKKGVKNIFQIMRGNRSFDNFNDDLKLLLSNRNVVLYEGIRRLVGGKREEWNRYGFRYSGVNVKYMAEQQPNSESRVTLGAEKDDYGQRKLKLNWILTEDDLNSIRRTLEIMDNEMRLEKAGHIEIDFDDSNVPKHLTGGYHHMGTTRMHKHERLGVVDEHCKVHGIDNLFIAGSSVFPTSGSANPTLTIVALSIRLADHLKKEKISNTD